jgi:hypothetical protein
MEEMYLERRSDVDRDDDTEPNVNSNTNVNTDPDDNADSDDNADTGSAGTFLSFKRHQKRAADGRAKEQLCRSAQELVTQNSVHI